MLTRWTSQNSVLGIPAVTIWGVCIQPSLLRKAFLRYGDWESYFFPGWPCRCLPSAPDDHPRDPTTATKLLWKFCWWRIEIETFLPADKSFIFLARKSPLTSSKAERYNWLKQEAQNGRFYRHLYNFKSHCPKESASSNLKLKKQNEYRWSHRPQAESRVNSLSSPLVDLAPTPQGCVFTPFRLLLSGTDPLGVGWIGMIWKTKEKSREFQKLGLQVNDLIYSTKRSLGVSVWMQITWFIPTKAWNCIHNSPFWLSINHNNKIK